ncbi:MAG: hypothetical protein QXS85_01110 [Acidilobaceae archaeon]
MVIAMQTDNVAQTTAMILLLTLVILAALAFFMSRQQSMIKSALAQTKKRYYTVIDCGGTRQVREFQPGDYVGKLVGPCGEGVEAWITGIYSEEEKQDSSQKAPS